MMLANLGLNVHRLPKFEKKQGKRLDDMASLA